MTTLNTKLSTGLCVASAFVPLLITAWDIHADVEFSEWQMLFNLVNLTAFLWLGLTIFHFIIDSPELGVPLGYSRSFLSRSLSGFSAKTSDPLESVAYRLPAVVDL